MRQIIAGVLVVAAVIGAYLGVAYHFEQVGQLKLMVADDVRVNRELKKQDAALQAYLPFLRDSASRASTKAAAGEHRRTVAVAASDSAALVTDAAIHAAADQASDSASKARLDSVATVVARERRARNRERAVSDSAIGFWKASDALWHRAADSTGSLADIRARRVKALTAENDKLQSLMPSRAGSAIRTSAAVLLTVLACHSLVRC